MGSYYRERHAKTATTTSDDINGLTGSSGNDSTASPDTTSLVAEMGELSLAELQAQAEERGLPTYGTKADLRERIAQHDAEA